MHVVVPRRSMAILSALAALLLTSCALLLSGCGGDPGSTSTENKAGGGAPAQGSAKLDRTPAQGGTELDRAPAKGAPEAKARSDAGSNAGGVAKPGTPAVGTGPKLTKTASLAIQVKNIAAAAARVRGIATGLQAQVLSEQLGKGGAADPKPLRDGSAPPNADSDLGDGDLGGFGTLSLSVPANKLDAALDQLAKVGKVLGRNTSSQDVTAEYVDTESRLKTMRASVERVRALLAQAKDLGQVVTLESEMSRRQADLESLESQLTALKNNVQRSTLTVSLSTSSQVDEPAAENGFLAGLRSGWDAFTASASGLFTAIGAVLPFAVFFALVGAPVVLWWRRRASESKSQ